MTVGELLDELLAFDIGDAVEKIELEIRTSDGATFNLKLSDPDKKGLKISQIPHWI